MSKPPKCYDCGTTEPEPKRLNEDSTSHNDPAWECSACKAEYGYADKPFKLPPARSAEEWFALVRTMLPKPVAEHGDELWGGEPPTVVVSVTIAEIVIRTATVEWPGPHSWKRGSRPFAKRRLRAPAAEVAHLINAAHGKRLSEFKWCVRCHETCEPENMHNDAVCHGCAEQHLGIIH